MFGVSKRGHVLVAPLSLAVLALGPLHAQDAGFRGPSYEGAHSFPTGSKAQSKLWWNDGSWWGCLWSASAQCFMIHRLDAATETWIDTGTAVDSRPKCHADCLWDGTKLYIATHLYTTGGGSPGHALELYRYGYDPNHDVYSLDVGFPSLIGDSTSEILVLDEDSTGTLWAAWMANDRVWFAHTRGDDHDWSVPSIHPQLTADLSGDDICALVPFQRDKLGLLWSDQVTSQFCFTFHRDGEPDSLWSSVETVVGGPQIADDHISARASEDGRIFAALKTTSNQILLAVRSAGGGWSGALVATEADGWTRPLLVLDEEHRLVHVFATSPVVLGTIYEKTSSMDALGFAPGIGTPVIRDARGPAFNDATSTKQSVSGSTGLVVLASQQVTQEYGHHHDSLGGVSPAPPKAALSADPTAGFEPLTVQFIDSSGGQPTTWSWAFGDGGTSTAQHPLHTYARVGRYTVTLQVQNALGSDVLTRTDLISVDAQPTALVLTPIADGQVRESSPDSNYGSLEVMRVREEAGSAYHSYLKFFVPPSDSQITSAVLRLHCTDGSPDGGSVFAVGSDWSEPGLDWIHAPELAGTPVGMLGNVTAGSAADLDLSSLVDRSGTVSLGMRSASTNSAYYSTRQGSQPPELLLTLQPSSASPPEPGFEDDKAAGVEPLTVQFFDTSNGPVSSWLWDFGDGSRSTLQNPSHVYAKAGTYTVGLTAANASGSKTAVEPGFVRVFPDKGGHRKGGGPPAPGVRTPPSAVPLTGLVDVARHVRYAFAALDERSALAMQRKGRGLELSFELRGTLEDVLGVFEDCLPSIGLEILAHGPDSSCDEVITLQLRAAECVGQLVLRQCAHESVLVSLSLTPE